MSPLRQQMIDAMVLRGLARRTQQAYLSVVAQLSLSLGVACAGALLGGFTAEAGNDGVNTVLGAFQLTFLTVGLMAMLAAAIWISSHFPTAPPLGWWIMTWAFSRAKRRSPAASSTAPMLAA